MNTDSSTLSELQSLLGGASGSSGGPSLIDTDAIIKAMMPITIILTALSVVIALLYIFSLVQRIRVDRATLESRNILREMNARDKARSTTAQQDTSPPASDATDTTKTVDDRASFEEQGSLSHDLSSQSPEASTQK